MATWKIPRLTTAERVAITPAVSEIIFDTDLNVPYYGDGSTVGGLVIGGGVGTVTSVGTGTGLSGGPITGSGTINMANTAVTPGAYTSSNITIDAQGRITAASSGAGGGDVTKVATPVNNQVGVWTGDGTLEGDSDLTFDGSNLDVGGNITVGGTVDGIDIATDVAANTAKTTNANHTGDVTGSTTLTIAANAVDDTHIDFGTGVNQVSTADLPEQTNLYYTEARVDANSSVAANTAKNTNVTTNLTTTQTTTTVDVVSSDGTDATLPQAIAAGNAGVMSGADKTKLDDIETSATADQTDAQIETAYDNQVDIVSQVDAEAGTATVAERWTPQRIAQAIAALESGGGGSSVYSFNRVIGTGTSSIVNSAGAITWNSSSDSSGSDVTWVIGNPTRLVAVSTGVYRVGGYVTTQSIGQRACCAVEILVDGVATGLQRSGSYIRNSGTAYDYWTLEISATPFSLSAGSYVELGVGRVSGGTYGYGGALTINCERSKSEFWLERVS